MVWNLLAGQTCIKRTDFHLLIALPLKFKEYLKDTEEVIEGQNVTLKVKVTKKGSKLRWYKNGKELKVDKRDKKYEAMQKGLVYTLTIKNVTKDDLSEYSATYHEDKTACQLLVEGI